MATLAVLLFVVLVRFPNHLNDAIWTVHAKTHLISQISVIAGLCTTMLILVWRFFHAGPRWLWWGLFAFGLFTFGGYWAGKLFFEAGTQWKPGNTLLLILTLTFIAGLLLSWPHFSSSARRPK